MNAELRQLSPVTTQVSRIEDLRRWQRVLTAHGAPVALSSADRELAAAVEHDDGSVTVLFLPEQASRFAVRAIEGRLKELQVPRVERFQTTPEILKILYDAANTLGAALNVGETDAGRLLNDILTSAVARGASDVHLNRDAMVTQVRIRVHGELVPLRTLSAQEGERLARATFAYAAEGTKGVDFNPAQLQDAQVERDIRIGASKRRVALRYGSMSTYPDGYDITLRVLGGRDEAIPGLADLGYDELQQQAFAYMLRKPIGAVFMVGPTGSGKSTTLAALTQILNARNGGRKLIRTIEDPPERVLPGTRQTAVVRTASGGSDFARVLKAAMRNDPDMLLVGEVRDEETAELAMDAVMTGHFMLSTTHAASPFDAIERLIRKGFERATMAADDILAGIVSQRLLPVLCQHCAQTWGQVQARLPGDHLARVRATQGEWLDALRYRGEGCEHCKEGIPGVAGRTVAASFLLPDRQLRTFIRDNDRISAQAYWRSRAWEGTFAVNGGTLLEQATHKMRLGLIAPLDVELTVGDLDADEPRAAAGEWLGQNHPHLRSVA